MSIVPYATRQIVLRHHDAVVVFDTQSKQFDVASHRGAGVAECPYCLQPYHRDDRPRSPGDGNANNASAGGFVSPEYFRMLQDSLPSSKNSSAPPSPRRRLVEPVKIEQSSSTPLRFTNYNGNTSGSSSSPTGISANAFSPGYFQRFFKVQKELGRGGKGVVFLVTHYLDKVDLGQYACKRVPVGNDHVWLTNVLNEVRLLEHLSHQHLVYYKHVWLEDIKISKFGPSVPCAFILQQYCNAGDLHQYVIDPLQQSDSPQALKERMRRRSLNHPEPVQDLTGRRLRLEEIYQFFKDITSGLNHLHVNGFIHRDLKPSNCLLHDSGKGFRVLVSDFGEVQVENMVRKSTGATGTVSYCAPEVLRQQPTGCFGNFTTKSDIFSLGMILYFLCFAQLPYRHADHLSEENEDLDSLRAEIITWAGLREERKLRPDLPEQLYTFLRRLLSLDPDERPAAEDILLGIKTGSGLDEISDNRPNSSAHMFDDLSASSRISPIDSPRSSTPTRKSSTGFARPGGSSKLRLSSFYREPAQSSVSVENDDETKQPTSPGGSLVLRGSFPSPTRMRERPTTFQNRSWHPWGTQVSTLHWPLRVVLLLLKVITLNVLCSPMASNPMVSYPLLGIASLDVLFLTLSPVVSITLALLHFAILYVASRASVACVGGLEYWKKL